MFDELTPPEEDDFRFEEDDSIPPPEEPAAEIEPVVEEVPTAEETPIEETPAEVEEEERTDDGSEGLEAKEDEPEEKKEKTPIINPHDTDPYEWDNCAITVNYLWASNGEVAVNVRNHQDQPMVRIFKAEDVPLKYELFPRLLDLRELFMFDNILVAMVLLPVEPGNPRKVSLAVSIGDRIPFTGLTTIDDLDLPRPIRELLQELRADMPMRSFKQSEVRAKAELERKQKEAKAAANKAKVKSNYTPPVKQQPVLKGMSTSSIQKLSGETPAPIAPVPAPAEPKKIEPKKPDEDVKQFSMF